MKYLFLIFWLFFSALCSAGENRWTTSGPNGGPAQFLFHPQNTSLVYALSGANLFRSRNTGKSWSRLPRINLSGTVFIGIDASSAFALVALSPADGTYKSTDEGNTWQKVAEWKLPGEPYCDLQFDQKSPEVAYLTSEAHVFKSTDSGKSWAKKSKGLPRLNNSGGCSVIRIDPSNASTLYFFDGRIFKSTDAGENWRLLNGSPKIPEFVRTLEIATANPRVIYAGGDTGIWKSTNGGVDWSDTDCKCQALQLSVNPRNAERVYVAAGSAALSSSDGGNTWVHLKLPVNEAWISIAANPLDSNLLFADSTARGIFRSINRGATWIISNSGFNALESHQLALSPLKPEQVWSLSGNHLYRSLNAGDSWQPLKNIGLVSMVKVHPRNPAFIAAVHEGAIALSTNGGESWAQNAPAAPDFIFFLALDPTRQNVMYETQNRGIFRSTDTGQTWNLFLTKVLGNVVCCIEVDPRNDQILYTYGVAYSLYKSANGGKTWEVSNPSIEDLPVIDPVKTNNLYLLTYGSESTISVFASANGGKTWKKRSNGLPARSIYSLAIDPVHTSTLFASDGEMIFITLDGGNNWASFDRTGWPSGSTIFDLKVASDGTIFAATNRGVFAYSKR